MELLFYTILDLFRMHDFGRGGICQQVLATSTRATRHKPSGQRTSIKLTCSLTRSTCVLGRLGQLPSETDSAGTP